MADDSKHDLSTIGQAAQNQADRRLALNVCLTAHWPAEDIARLERRDAGGWNGWDMWRRAAAAAPAPGT